MSDVQPAPIDPNLAAPPVDPAVVDPTAGNPPPVDPAVVDPAPVEPTPGAGDHGNKGKAPWFMRELAAKDAELAEAKRRADAAEDLARRLQNGNSPPQNPSGTPAPSATEAEINARATQIAIARDVAEVDRKGVAKFGDAWAQTVGTLTTLGANSLNFMEDVMAADRANAHELLSSLAAEPERLATVARLPQAQRIAELTRIAMSKSSTAAPAAPAAPGKTVSRAPAPPPSLNPGGKKAVDWRSDEASDAEFDQGFTEMMQRRAGGRR
jgi:hypothetical protein